MGGAALQSVPQRETADGHTNDDGDPVQRQIKRRRVETARPRSPRHQEQFHKIGSSQVEADQADPSERKRIFRDQMRRSSVGNGRRVAKAITRPKRICAGAATALTKATRSRHGLAPACSRSETKGAASPLRIGKRGTEGGIEPRVRFWSMAGQEKACVRPGCRGSVQRSIPGKRSTCHISIGQKSSTTTASKGQQADRQN